MGRMHYSRRHYDRLRNGPPDTSDTIAERIRYRAVAEQAVREREERYPILTAENAADAMKWQEARIRELLSRVSP